MASSVRAVAVLAMGLGMSAAGPARAETPAPQGVVAAARLISRPLPFRATRFPSVLHALAGRPARPARVVRAGMPPESVGVARNDSMPRPLPIRRPPIRMRVSVAAAHATVLDPVASPLRYGGGGPAVLTALSYASRSGSTALELSAEAAFPQLRSVLSAQSNGPRETTIFTSAHALWLRRLSGEGAAREGSDFFWRHSRQTLMLGAELRFEGSVRDHRYREPALHFFYGLALAAAGPAARWRTDLGNRGELSLDAAAPLLALAYRPYGDMAYARSGVHPRVAAPPSFGALDAGATWAVPLGRTGARGLAEWRLGYLTYRDHERYRAAHQRLGLALELPAGGTR